MDHTLPYDVPVSIFNASSESQYMIANAPILKTKVAVLKKCLRATSLIHLLES